MTKLRMTGFECFTVFVIRRAKHTPSKERGPPFPVRACLGIMFNLMSFPIDKMRLILFYFTSLGIPQMYIKSSNKPNF
jgi:hypothetical protein